MGKRRGLWWMEPKAVAVAWWGLFLVTLVLLFITPHIVDAAGSLLSESQTVR